MNPNSVMDELLSTLCTNLSAVVCEEMRVASNYVTRLTIHLRVLKHVTEYLNIPWYMLYEFKNLIPLHKDCLTSIENHWEVLQRRQSVIPITMEDTNTFEKCMGRDFCRPSDMIKLAGVLLKHSLKSNESSVLMNLYKIFAMDGFQGNDIKNYVDTLKYGNDSVDTPTEYLQQHHIEAIHVRSVRKLYNEMKQPQLEKMHAALMQVFKPGDVDEECQHLADLYKSEVGNALYRIAEWKMLQFEKYQKEKVSVTPAANKTKLKRKAGEDEKVHAKKRKSTPKSELAVPKVIQMMSEVEEERLESPTESNVKE